MAHAIGPLDLRDEVRAGWNAVRRIQAGGERPVVTVVGPMASRAAQALAALEGCPVTVFSAEGVVSRNDWYSIEVRTPIEGLPNGTEATKTGTYRLPTILPEALIRTGDHILVILGVDRVPSDSLNGLRAILDDAPQIPLSGRSVSEETLIVLTAERLTSDVRRALEGRLGSVIELP